jgi:adenylate kinase family enzyme
MIEHDAASARTLNYVPMQHALGSRISVVGNGGKTTLATALVAKTNLAFIELDAIHWKPNWVECTPDELAEGVNAAIEAAPGGWIVDGHYWSKIGDLVLSQAD